jgi:hypothetical protein
MEGKTEGTGKIKHLLDDLKETGRYWKLNEVALVCSLWRTHFGKVSCHRLCEGDGGDDDDEEDDDDDSVLIQMIDLVELTSNQSFSHHSLK